MALAMVLGIGLVLLLMVATIMNTSISGVVRSKTDQDNSAAIAAAYAGVEDYQSKLANDNTYVQYGNSASTFGAGSTFTSTNGNNAFGIGKAGTWQQVSGSSGRARYRYEVDNSQYGATGVLRLRSTGLVGSSVRTVVVDLKQLGFINYLYYSDYEITDPLYGNSRCTPAYAWATSTRPNCDAISFGSSDELSGPVHSNDTLQICGTTFDSSVETGYNPKTGNAYITPSGCNKAAKFNGGVPKYAPVITMPATNQYMIQETRSDLTTTTVPRPGCLYTGPTSIIYNDDGTMTVRSPWTLATNFTADASGNVTGGSANPACGTPGYAAKDTLGSPAGQTFKVPENNLIFVQGVPRTSNKDPNYWKSGDLPTGITCTGGKSNKLAGNGIGFPAANEAMSGAASQATYGCDTGDAFVQGTVLGKSTVSAANYVFVTGDIKYSKTNPTANILGLVGQNAVWVYNPVDASGNLLYPGADREIDAAILSVAHSFIVQNFTEGLKGTLTVNGSIAQEFRGPVGQGTSNGVKTSGYSKDYGYDNRLQFTAPPKFLSPVSTSYGISTLTETKDAFKADGSAN